MMDKECVIIALGGAQRGRYNSDGIIEQQIECNNIEASNAITSVQKDSLVIEAYYKKRKPDILYEGK